MIQTVKKRLASMSFAGKYTFEHLRTIMYEVTQVLNSRPLFSVDGQVITPAHFMSGKPLTALPPVGGGGLKRFSSQLMDIAQHQKKVNGFWRHWLKSYLMQLPSVHVNPKSKCHILAVGESPIRRCGNAQRSLERPKCVADWNRS